MRSLASEGREGLRVQHVGRLVHQIPDGGLGLGDHAGAMGGGVEPTGRQQQRVAGRLAPLLGLVALEGVVAGQKALDGRRRHVPLPEGAQVERHAAQPLRPGRPPDHACGAADLIVQALAQPHQGQPGRWERAEGGQDQARLGLARELLPLHQRAEGLAHARLQRVGQLGGLASQQAHGEQIGLDLDERGGEWMQFRHGPSSATGRAR
jgi:hypothetical protein